ncbi:MAG: ABC transporter permease [Acetivibrio ethanolgignens]
MKVKINPVYKKELKISVRSIRLSLTMLAYNTLLAMIGLLAFYFNFEDSGYRSINYSGMLIVYTLIAVLEFALILFVVPAFTANAIAGEREKQTLEILLTTTLKPEQIIIGKLMSSISTIILLIFSSFPIMAIVFAVGGVRFIDLLRFMVFACITAVFIGSIGILFSTLFKKTVPATVFTYGAVLVLTLGTLAVLFVIYLLVQQSYETQYYNNGAIGSYNPPKLENLSLLLLINPAVTMVSMITKQYGSREVLVEFLNTFGGVHEAVSAYWDYISIGIQLLLSGIFLKIAAWKLRVK